MGDKCREQIFWLIRLRAMLRSSNHFGRDVTSFNRDVGLLGS